MSSTSEKAGQAPKDPRQPEYGRGPIQPQPYPTSGAYGAPPPNYGMYGAPPPNYQYQQYGDNSKIAPPGPGSTGQRRGYEGGYKDVWAGVLFIVQFLAMHVILIYLGVKGIQNTPETTSDTSSVELKNWLPQLLGAAGLGLVFASLWLQLIRMAPTAMIYVSLWWGVFASAALGGFLLSIGDDSRWVGIFFLVMALLNLFYAIAVRSRIPFASAMLRQAVTVIGHFPSTIWAAMLCLVLSVEFIAVWVFGVSGAASQNDSIFIIIGLLISLYWTMEVFHNLSHVTTAGTVATYYFQRQNMPGNPTGRSLKRAATSSFGSICLGSLLVAIIQTARTLVQSVARQGADNPIEAILASCAECILACIESLLRFFNKWAYVQVAVYGKSFVESARDTWDLFQNQGFHLVINDDLIMGVLFMGCFIGGLIVALSAGLWTYFKVDEDLAAGVAVISFFIAYFMTSIIMSVIESSVATYYVCYAEDPATLQRNDPAFYEVIRSRHTLLMQ